jgi:hypothetical protein
VPAERLELLAAASRRLRGQLAELSAEELRELHDLLERVLDSEVIDRPAIAELEARLLR